MKLPHRQLGVFVMMVAMGNTVFIGLAMCLELFGDIATPYVMLFYLVSSCFTQLIGIPLVRWSGEAGGFSMQMVWKFLRAPTVVSVFLSLLLVGLDIHTPEPCDELREIHQQHRHTAGAAADGLHHPRDRAAQPAPDTHARRDDVLPLCHLTGAGRCPLRAARHRRSGAQRICCGVGHAGHDADGRRRGGIRRGRAAGRAGRGDLHPRLASW